MTTIRDLDRTRDRRAVEAIDTTFETASRFEVVTTARAIELVERPLPAPMAKRYSIQEVFAPWARWDIGWVADDGGVRGFATAGYEAWHERLVLWFLYIAPAWRRRGLGRQLLARVEAHGRQVGASHVWLETSNVQPVAGSALKSVRRNGPCSSVQRLRPRTTRRDSTLSRPASATSWSRVNRPAKPGTAQLGAAVFDDTIQVSDQPVDPSSGRNASTFAPSDCARLAITCHVVPMTESPVLNAWISLR